MKLDKETHPAKCPVYEFVHWHVNKYFDYVKWTESIVSVSRDWNGYERGYMDNLFIESVPNILLHPLRREAKKKWDQDKKR